LTKFARIYSNKFNIDFDKMMKKMWGDNFYDPKAKKFKVDEFTEEGT